MSDLVSVIVPVYKAENYIDRCVGSIVGQTFHNLEIILVDDGSTDRCPELCEQWAYRDARIRVIHPIWSVHFMKLFSGIAQILLFAAMKQERRILANLKQTNLTDVI